MMPYALLILLVSVLWFTAPAHATDRNAASCSYTDVQAAIDSAVDGDRVLIPAGTCTWATSPTVPATKGLQIVGAGIGQTIINGTTQPLTITAGNGKFSRVTGMEMSHTAATNNVVAVVRSDTAYGGNTVRIDHNKFGGKVYVNCYCYGLIDSNTFTSGSVYSTIWVFENSYDRPAGGGDGGAASWARADNLGAADTWVIEDNTFTFSSPAIGSSVADSRSGGRQTFRYNTITNANWSVHDARQPNERGTRQYEVYKNTFTFTANIQGSLYNFGSGSGVIWGNRIKGTAFTDSPNRGIRMQNWRSTGGILAGIDPWQDDADGFAGPFCVNGPPTTCSGTCSAPGVGPCVDMDGSLGSGYPARDQIGRGLTNTTTGVQDAFPLYFIDNFYCVAGGAACNPDPAVNGLAADPFVPATGLNQTHIVINRDYYQPDATNCPSGGGSCTQGVGSGSLANRPSSCTTGVGYWATDQGNWNKIPGGSQGVLYKCTSTDTWTLYYTPYEYPHPLQGYVAPTNRRMHNASRFSGGMRIP